MKTQSTYYSPEFDEYLTIQKRMPKTVAVEVYDERRGRRWYRWTRANCAAFLRGCLFRKVRINPPAQPEK